MKKRGRPVLGAIVGFFTGLFLALALLFNGVIPLESNLLVILPIAGLVLNFALAMWFSIPTKKSRAAETAASASAERAVVPVGTEREDADTADDASEGGGSDEA